MNAIEQFIISAHSRGLIIKQPIADGRLHRCDVEGKNGRGDGAYILHLDGFPAGGFQNHKDGRGWENWHINGQNRLSANELAAYRQKLEAIRREREAETKRRHDAGQAKANALLSNAQPATDDHPYLICKSVKAHSGVYLGHWKQRKKDNCLLLPLYDNNGVVWNVQAIFPEKDKALERDKDFLWGARKSGLFFPIGDFTNASTILVGEGYATMATCHAVIGLPALVAFDAGNIPNIKLPPLPIAEHITICADNDESGTGERNALTAKLAWEKQGRKVTIFKPHSVGQDFNDVFTKFSWRAP